jgi:hypothetical protein
MLPKKGDPKMTSDDHLDPRRIETLITEAAAQALLAPAIGDRFKGPDDPDTVLTVIGTYGVRNGAVELPVVSLVSDDGSRVEITLASLLASHEKLPGAGRLQQTWPFVGPHDRLTVVGFRTDSHTLYTEAFRANDPAAVVAAAQADGVAVCGVFQGRLTPVDELEKVAFPADDPVAEDCDFCHGKGWANLFSTDQEAWQAAASQGWILAPDGRVIAVVSLHPFPVVSARSLVAESQPAADVPNGSDLHAGTVSLGEELGPYRVFLPNQRWNGWGIPYFVKEEADRYLSDLRALGGMTIAEYDVKRDLYRFQEIGEDAPEEFERLPNGLFCLGGWKWTWHVEQEDL